MQAARGPINRHAEAAAAICAVVGVGFGTHLVIQLLNVSLYKLGVSSLWIGVSTSAQAIGIVAGAPAALFMLRNRGVRSTLLVGVLLSAAMLGLLSQATSFWTILVLRAVYGAALALVFTGSEFLVLSRAPDSRKGRTVGLYATALALGAAAGPAFVSAIGLPTHLAYVMAMLTALASVPPILASVTEERAAAAVSRSTPWPWLLGIAPLGFAAAFVFGLLDNGALSLIGVYGVLRGLDAADAPKLIAASTIGAIVCQVPIGRLVDRIPTRWAFIGCVLAASALLLLLPFAWEISLLALLMLFLLGAMIEGFYTIGLADIAKRVPLGGLAAANAVFVAICGLGEVVGPLLAGAGLEQQNAQGFVLAPIVLMVALTAFALDQRVAPRKRMCRIGVVVPKATCARVPCVVLDLSRTGARLHIEEAQDVPAEFELGVDVESLTVGCEVVWRKGHEVGVRFLGPPLVASLPAQQAHLALAPFGRPPVGSVT